MCRCGEHSDYGTLTLLYQDELGGLEVKGVEGGWIQADPLPGCLLVNVGDLLEAVSGGRYPATRHRVRVPEQELRRRTSRQSIVFFVHPDDEVACIISTYLHLYLHICISTSRWCASPWPAWGRTPATRPSPPGSTSTTGWPRSSERNILTDDVLMVSNHDILEC